MSAALYGAGLAVLNGQVYRFGGADAGGYLSSVEAYSIAGGTWSPVAALPQPLAYMAALAYGNYLYIAGGNSGGTLVAKTYRYDPAANTWNDAAIADLPSPAAIWPPGCITGAGCWPAASVTSRISWPAP